MLKNKLFFRVFLNSALGILLIYIWSRFVNLSEILKILKTIDLKFGLVFIGLFLLSSLFRALRLKFLLKDYKLSLKDILMLNFLCQFLSFMIPIRAGEIAKGIYFNSQLGLPVAKTLIWVLVDRFLDFWIALISISILITLIPTNIPLGLSRSIFILLIIFSLAALLLITSQNFFKKMMLFLSNFLVFSSIKKWFVSFTSTIIDGFKILHRPVNEILVLVFLSAVATLVDSLAWLFIFLSLNVNLGFLKSVLGNSLAALTFLVPAAPGYVGSAEASFLAVFSGILGFEANMVSAAAVFFHILTVLLILILGITSIYLLKFDLGLVWKKIRKQ